MASLFDTAERSDAGCLDTLALRILDSIESISSDNRRALTSLVHQRIQVARKGVHAPEFELQLIHISTTVMYLVNVALGNDSNTRPRTLAVLKDLTQALPKVTERDEFARYVKATGFLKS